VWEPASYLYTHRSTGVQPPCRDVAVYKISQTEGDQTIGRRVLQKRIGAEWCSEWVFVCRGGLDQEPGRIVGGGIGRRLCRQSEALLKHNLMMAVFSVASSTKVFMNPHAHINACWVRAIDGMEKLSFIGTGGNLRILVSRSTTYVRSYSRPPL
jgi:hypothetical protein